MSVLFMRVIFPLKFLCLNKCFCSSQSKLHFNASFPIPIQEITSLENLILFCRYFFYIHIFHFIYVLKMLKYQIKLLHELLYYHHTCCFDENNSINLFLFLSYVYDAQINLKLFLIQLCRWHFKVSLRLICLKEFTPPMVNLKSSLSLRRISDNNSIAASTIIWKKMFFGRSY